MATPITFKFSGEITPDQLRHAARPVEPIPYKMDEKLLKAIKDYTGKKRSGPGAFMMEAVQAYITDMDSILLSAIECKARQHDFGTSSSMVQVDAVVGDMLTQAAEFLKTKGYSRLGRGGIMVACALLHADKTRLIPSFEAETKQMLAEGKTPSKK